MGTSLVAPRAALPRGSALLGLQAVILEPQKACFLEQNRHPSSQAGSRTQALMAPAAAGATETADTPSKKCRHFQLEM